MNKLAICFLFAKSNVPANKTTTGTMKGTDKPIERAKSLRITAPRTEKPAETKMILEKTLPATVVAVDAFDEKIPIIGASTTFLLLAHTNNPMVARPAKIPVTEANIGSNT